MMLNLPPPYSQYTQFARFNASDPTEWFDEAMNAVYILLGTGPSSFNAKGAVDHSQLMPGLLQTDYQTYYEACSPSMCTYNYQGKQPFIKGLTAAFGK